MGYVLGGSMKNACAAILLTALCVSPALAADPGGDATRGARLFLQCRACHAVGQSDPSGVGPNLWGVFGAKAGARPDFHYSPALSAAGLTWTPQNLDQWLVRPTAVVPGTTMAFQGVASAQARKDLIAYLATLAPKTAKLALAHSLRHPSPETKPESR